MVLFLTILSGIGWSIVYEECIRLGFKQRTFSMPFFALGLNFTWELLYTLADIFLNAHGPLTGINQIQVIVNIIWVCLDALILLTYFRYGKNEWTTKLSNKLFLPWSILVLLCCFALQLAFMKQFGFIKAAQYSAFLQNLLMSIMFIEMYLKRKNMHGQSILLAIAKWIGTLAPTIIFGIMNNNWVVLVCGIFCTVFDLIYIALLVDGKNKLKKGVLS